MSLAAIPVYLLALRLGLSRRIALALAALALLVPDLLYASFVTSEPFAYPLVLAAVAAATIALAEPTRRAQLAFVAFAALAALTRAQLAVLPIVFFCAALVLGARERRIKAALREQLLPICVFAASRLRSGPRRPGSRSRLLPPGSPSAPASDRLPPLVRLGHDGAGLRRGLDHRPRRSARPLARASTPRLRLEQSFGVVVVLLAAALVTEAGLLQANAAGRVAVYGVNEIKERYVFYVAPLLGICFALYAKRGWPAPRSSPRARRGTRDPLGACPAERLRDRRRPSTPRRSCSASTGSPASSAEQGTRPASSQPRSG